VSAPDADAETLHIRCGSDIRQTLTEAGFAGNFLEYANPLCQGPVLPGDDWLVARARFIAGAYGAAGDVLARLQADEAALSAAASRYERVVMWFEHDHYDQLIIARCLDVFAGAQPPVLELISVADYPVEGRFRGLGQLRAEDLLCLWPGRMPVSAAALRAGRAVWHALRAADPTELAALAPLSDPPHLGGAVRRHLQELPWTSDGLSLTQRLVLQLVAEGPIRIGMVFHRLMEEREPLPWLGDIMLRPIVEDMKRTAVFTGAVDDGEQRWWRETLTIADAGRRVLAGTVDFLSLAPAERWVGGVAVRGDAPCWRWDERDGPNLVRR
jgi:hypothetical protein